MSEIKDNARKAIWITVIVIVSACLGTLVDWRAPGIERYAHDWLMRARGPLAAPEDIAIVAIDEASISRLGRFPWPRSIAARTIDAVAAAQPKAVALDVLYSDPTTEAEDSALARAIARAGNVVVAAQLNGSPATGGAVSWLMPLLAIAKAAAGIGHVNVSTESDGIAREVLLRAADDSGRGFLAMAAEVVRIGDRIPDVAVVDTPHALLLGPRVIPVETSGGGLTIGKEGASPAAVQYRAERLTVDYIGPAGSFASVTYSVADLLDGRVPAERLRGKYVLIGGTAAAMGDRVASPFVHQSDVRSNQNGELMPGVEVLANALNTILRSRFYSNTPDWLGFLSAAFVAGLTLFLLSAAQGRHEVFKQTAALAAVGAGIVVAAYLAFTRFLTFYSLTPNMVSFASAGIFGLLRRSLVTSARLDATISNVARAGEGLMPLSPVASAAESIARLCGASGVGLYSGSRSIATYGTISAPNGRQEQQRIPLAGGGLLVIVNAPGQPPPADTVRLAAAIAAGAIASAGAPEQETRAWFPRGIEWKARALDHLNGRILDRARFVDSALRSVDDGLIIAGPDGRITFVNRRAAAILGASEHALIGRDLLERLAEAENSPAGNTRDILARLVLERASIEREITIRDVRSKHYVLRLTAVCAGKDEHQPVLGMVASLSDITRHHELQQTKNDVVALVSHEMRTPLTAIQGMSELLAQYDVDPARRKEMDLAINDEVKRLARMIDQYLDITRLESGKTELRRSPVRLDTLIERVLLLLDPLAAQRKIRLLRQFEKLPALLADPDLLSRAITNLVSNAIKYSPAGTEVKISTSAGANGARIDVADHGYGIPDADLGRIFDKFHRVARVEDADVPGTGLGLSLVREIAELHGGTVTVQSSVGVGSVFTLCIPQGEEK